MSALREPTDVPADLAALAREFARVFLVYGRGRPIALLHSVTAPVAARSVLPLLPAEVARPTYDALWQVGAALYAVYTGGTTPEPLPVGPPPSADELTDRAVATGDEHAIKLTEACLRLDAETPIRCCTTRRPGRRSCSASLIPMAKAGGRRRPKKARDSGRRALPGGRPRPRRIRVPPRRSAISSPPPSGRPCRRSATAAGTRTALTWTRSRSSGRRVDRRGQPGRRRVPARVGGDRLAARLAARPSWPGTSAGSCRPITRRWSPT